VTSEQMHASFERADSTKSKRASELLSQVDRSGKPDPESRTQSAEEAH
jgi:hypothetical protein